MSSRRAIVFVVFAGLLFGLFVHYGATAHLHDDSPSGTALESDYPSHVGKHIYRWARITEVKGDRIIVRSGSLTLTVLDRPDTADVGDAVQIDGRLASDHRVVPNRVVVSDRGGLTAMYGISAIGGLWALWLFTRYWTVDWRSLTIIPREDPN